jgi:hypothetical protein
MSGDIGAQYPKYGIYLLVHLLPPFLAMHFALNR